MELIHIEIERPEDPIRIKQYPIPMEGRRGLKPVIKELIRKGTLNLACLGITLLSWQYERLMVVIG